MSIKMSKQDARSMASTQVSRGEVLDDFDVEELVEEPEIDPSVDLTLKVGVAEDGCLPCGVCEPVDWRADITVREGP
jgi:hypothetical protein